MKKNKSFTMSEILISLTIIGIIAAITLPSLRDNINEKAWQAQRKALYSRMSQAISMMPSLNGYGIGTNDAETASKAAQAFITDGLSKVLKINNICDSENIKKCGFPDKINVIRQSYITENKIDTPKKLSDLNNQFIPFTAGQLNYDYSQVNTNTAAFETANGQSILTFYNPNCSYNMTRVNGYDLAQPTMCANFIYDLNGKRGPNQVGKDIGFITAFYPSDSVVVTAMPLGKCISSHYSQNINSISEANALCKNQNPNYKLPNLEEIEAMWVNRKLTSLWGNDYITSTYKENKYWKFAVYSGRTAGTTSICKGCTIQCIVR